MKDKKRYAVQLDVYVYAENDYMARKRAHKMADKIDEKYPNARTQVTEIGEQPFASLGYRKIDYCGPVSEDKVDEPLPF